VRRIFKIKTFSVEDAVNIKNMMPRAGVVQSIAAMIAICIGCSSKESVPPVVGMMDSTVTINGMAWTKQNLNIKTKDSWCYDNKPANCKKYGRLYTWEAAKDACASMGDKWRVATSEDWHNLMEAGGGVRGEFDNEGSILYLLAGEKLKSKSGWNESGNGTDDYGFSALPGGFRYPDGDFDSAGNGFWWTATESSDGKAYYRSMTYHIIGIVNGGRSGKSDGFSVRCVAKD
jgi:uncharacterized protein (TIGR02145 family)